MKRRESHSGRRTDNHNGRDTWWAYRTADPAASVRRLGTGTIPIVLEQLGWGVEKAVKYRVTGV